MAAKINPLLKKIREVLKAYTKASASLVRVYEETIMEYWKEDAFGGYRNTELLMELVNGLSDHPRVQAAALRIAKTHGKFKITTEGESSERTLKVTEWKNVKISEDERDAFRAEVLLFRSYQYTSLLNERNEIARDFDPKAAREGLKKKALSFAAETMIDAQAKGEDVTSAAVFSGLIEAMREIAADPQALIDAMDEIRNVKAEKANVAAEKAVKIAEAKEQIAAAFAPATAE